MTTAKSRQQSSDKDMLDVRVGIGHPEGGPLVWINAVVDTSFAFARLPASLLAPLNVEPLERRQGLDRNGSSEEYDFGVARMCLEQEEWSHCPVVFGSEDEYTFGPITLGFLGLQVDSSGTKIEKAVRRLPTMTPIGESHKIGRRM